MTLKEQVLQHWNENHEKAVDGTLTLSDIHGSKCAYCKKFSPMSFSDCTGCPIFEKTKLRYCAGSPWHDVSYALVIEENIVSAVDEMIEFLKTMPDLLPFEMEGMKDGKN